MPTREEDQIARGLLLAALGMHDSETPAEVKGLPKVARLEITRQWVDERTGHLMAEGIAHMVDGSTQGHNGRLVPVFGERGAIKGYKIAIPSPEGDT